MQPCSSRRQNHLRIWCHVVRTQHHLPSTPDAETIRTEGPYHGPINGKLQCWAGSADEDINLFLVGGKNYSLQLHEGHDGEIDGLGSKIGPKPPPGY